MCVIFKGIVTTNQIDYHVLSILSEQPFLKIHLAFPSITFLLHDNVVNMRRMRIEVTRTERDAVPEFGGLVNVRSIFGQFRKTRRRTTVSTVCRRLTSLVSSFALKSSEI